MWFGSSVVVSASPLSCLLKPGGPTRRFSEHKIGLAVFGDLMLLKHLQSGSSGCRGSDMALVSSSVPPLPPGKEWGRSVPTRTTELEGVSVPLFVCEHHRDNQASVWGLFHF